VSNDKCIKQSRPFTLWGISKAAIPIGQRGTQFASPEAQNAQLEFYGGELFGG
jgi:hypothetical protein